MHSVARLAGSPAKVEAQSKSLGAMEMPPPAPRAATLSFRESPREVALIDETARKRDRPSLDDHLAF
jgi:hypothetical protein